MPDQGIDPLIRRLTRAFGVLLVCWTVLHVFETFGLFGFQRSMAQSEVRGRRQAESMRETVDLRVELRQAANSRDQRKIRNKIRTKERDVMSRYAEQMIEARVTAVHGGYRSLQMRTMSFGFGLLFRMARMIAAIVVCWTGFRIVTSADATNRWRVIGGLAACAILYHVTLWNPIAGQAGGLEFFQQQVPVARIVR